MSATCRELVGLTLTCDPANPGGVSKYLVLDEADPFAAQLLVLAEAPATAVMTVPLGADAAAGTVYRLGLDMRELGAGCWESTVRYGLPRAADSPSYAPPPVPGVPPPPPPPAPSATDPTQVLAGGEWQFDTTGGTEHVTQSLETRSRSLRGVPPVLGLATDGPDYRGAIGMDQDGKVQGADRYVGRLEWSLTLQRVPVTVNYVRFLAQMTGTTNSAAFFGRQEQELLFLGGSGGFRTGQGWTVTYKFAEGAAKNDVRVPEGLADADTIIIPRVYPFDHVWFVYETVTDGGRTVQRPKQAMVERMYRKTNFAGLGI